MATLQDLIAQVEDESLRDRIREEADRLLNQKNSVSSLRSICRSVPRSIMSPSVSAALSP